MPIMILGDRTKSKELQKMGKSKKMLIFIRSVTVSVTVVKIINSTQISRLNYSCFNGAIEIYHSLAH